MKNEGKAYFDYIIIQSKKSYNLWTSNEEKYFSLKLWDNAGNISEEYDSHKNEFSEKAIFLWTKEGNLLWTLVNVNKFERLHQVSV